MFAEVCFLTGTSHKSLPLRPDRNSGSGGIPEPVNSAFLLIFWDFEILWGLFRLKIFFRF